MYRKYLPWHVDRQKRVVALKNPIEDSPLNERIVLLTWNVHKNNHAIVWLEDFAKILHRYRPDLILFQEYQTMNRMSVLDRHHEYGYGFFPNIIWKEKHFGLINASRSAIVTYDYYTSEGVEPIIKTPKIMLETVYRTVTGAFLRVVNVHMINFVKIEKFIAQMAQIERVLAKDNEALILSGDFNTWNKKRMTMLLQLTQKYELEDVKFCNNEHRKKPFPYPLDHVFYRGLSLQKAEVLSGIDSSDHKPLLTIFTAK